MAAFNRRELDSLELEGRGSNRRHRDRTQGGEEGDDGDAGETTARGRTTRRGSIQGRPKRKGCFSSAPQRTVAAAAARAERRKVDCGWKEPDEAVLARASIDGQIGRQRAASTGWLERAQTSVRGTPPARRAAAAMPAAPGDFFS